MPSERFFNLPKEKKDRIIQASIKEFTRTDEKEVSINRIIQDAGIPRGSFYQYFADKDDLRDYLLQDFLTYIKKEVISYIDQDRGDMFQLAMDAINEMEKIIHERHDIGLILCKAFSQYQMEKPKKNMCEVLHAGEILQELFEKLKSRYYSGFHEEDVKITFEMLIELTMQTIHYMIMDNENIQGYKDKFKKKVQIVELGLKTKENANV